MSQEFFLDPVENKHLNILGMMQSKTFMIIDECIDTEACCTFDNRCMEVSTAVFRLAFDAILTIVSMRSLEFEDGVDSELFASEFESGMVLEYHSNLQEKIERYSLHS